MPANHKVSVGWQIVFSFIPFVNLWAFYRIRKLRRYLIFVIVPAFIMTYYFGGLVPGDIFYLVTNGWQTARDQESNSTELQADINDTRIFNRVEVVRPFGAFTALGGIAFLVRLAFQGFAVYLVIKWSGQHNRKFETPAPTAG